MDEESRLSDCDDREKRYIFSSSVSLLAKSVMRKKAGKEHPAGT